MTKKEIIKKEKYNEKQRLLYEWRVRAKKVCIKPLLNRRPTPEERKKWENEIIKAEKECGICFERKKVVNKHYEEKLYKKYLKNKNDKKNKKQIYLISEPNNGYIKIGYTSRGVKKRLSSMQTGNPGKLKIVAKYDGSLKDEKILHLTFEEQKVLGEWFELNDIALNYIDCYFKNLKPIRERK